MPDPSAVPAHTVAIAAIVVNWHDWPKTLAAVASLTTSEPEAADGRRVGVAVQAVVVDNESTPPVPDLPPGVELLCCPTNLGYAGGNNAGIRHVLARDPAPDAIAIINNDAVVAPDMLAELATYLEQHPDVGAVAPVLREPDGRHASSGGSWGLWRLGRYGEAPTGPRRVDFAIGAALLVPRTVMEAVGGFDERFFHYGEDLDFCLRLAASGYGVVVVPTAQAVHAGHNALAGRQDQLAYYVVRNAWLFAKKHGPRAPIGWAQVAAHLVPVRSWIRRRPTTAAAAWRGWWDGLRGIHGQVDIGRRRD
ncbi:MAG: glycosyltransferase family 2 protein [Thermaerobacter sp.]|nr:glycosyltransferase family 2 protein [Thermaerobacter sp.]